MNERDALAKPGGAVAKRAARRAERTAAGKNIETGNLLKKSGVRVNWKAKNALRFLYKLAEDSDYTIGNQRNNIAIADELNRLIEPDIPFDAASVRNKLKQDRISLECIDNDETMEGRRKRKRTEKSGSKKTRSRKR